MKLARVLRVNVKEQRVSFEDLPEGLAAWGGRGLIAKILNGEVPPQLDPLGPENKLIFACGPLAGTNAPQLGRISVGAKSPLTLGIKESNAGGPAAQKLDRLGIRAIVLEGTPDGGETFVLVIRKGQAKLVPAPGLKNLKIYRTAKLLFEKYEGKPALAIVGLGGERGYRAASIAFTDMQGDPSRNAGRGGLGAVMGSKGLKAVVIDDRGAPAASYKDKPLFKSEVKSWIRAIREDVVCGLFSTFGTPFTIASNSYQSTMPGNNYSTGRPAGFEKVTGEVIRRTLWERGSQMHGCMPGCVVQCSIPYMDAEGKEVCAAYEYEAVSMIGTNLGLSNPDEIARLKFLCDDLGIDCIEVGSSLAVAAQAGKMKIGDFSSAEKLFQEIERGTDLGRTLADGVVSTAKSFNISRVPAFKGQAIPAHDPRAVKGMGVTYATSPMGADHTAGLTYRQPLSSKGQIKNSVRFQIRAAVCDSFGYCLNSIPGRQASVYSFFANLMQARYGVAISPEDVLEMGKETIREELHFNEGAGFDKLYEPYPSFVREEVLPPAGHVFDVPDAELNTVWQVMDEYREPQKVWEIRIPQIPSMLVGAGVMQNTGRQARQLAMKKALIIADPVMEQIGRTAELQKILEGSGVDCAVFAGVQADPPVESIADAARFYRENDCNGLIALGGGSSMDSAKATAVNVSQPGPLTEYENMVGGKAKIKPPLPPIICIPTSSGTGSETNQFAVITDKSRDVKFTLMSDHIIPKVAVVDPLVCKTMPPAITASTGIDALSHCVEGYVGRNDVYHPYYEALALYGVRLVGRSLREAYKNGENIQARQDMCMAASFGGISFAKGLGLGHAISHVLGAFYHLPHGLGCALGLLCFVRAAKTVCRLQFRELAWALDNSEELEDALLRLYTDLKIPLRLRDGGIPEQDLAKIAFETSLNAVNLAANPVHLGERRILSLLKEFY